LEFETVAGFIPPRILANTGLIPLRDGSIAGIEYVTVPLEGEKGLQTAVNACEVLSKRTIYDDSCSLHCHIGNVPRTKEFILAFFKTICAIQDEIFEMFPLYKKYNFGVKNKNYSKPYPTFELLSQMDCKIDESNIDKNFDVLYTYLSMGQSFYDVDCDLNNVHYHPADESGNAKWGIRTRYSIANLCCLIFGNKATVEFRIHTPTTDVNKVIPFIILNSMIVNFAIRNQSKILKDPKFMCYTKLKDIVSDCIYTTSGVDNLNTLHESILRYIQDRKAHTEDQNKRGLIRGEEFKIPKCRHIDWNYKEPKVKEVKDVQEVLNAIKATPKKAKSQFEDPIKPTESYSDYMDRLEADARKSIARAESATKLNPFDESTSVFTGNRYIVGKDIDSYNGTRVGLREQMKNPGSYDNNITYMEGPGGVNYDAQYIKSHNIKSNDTWK